MNCGYTCNSGFADCDGVAANGCEINTRSNAANCSACGIVCPFGDACASGVCVTPVPATWSTNARAHRCAVDSRYSYTCPSGGTRHSVWGTDYYTDDSSICTAAVHAGRITYAGGGIVTIQMRPGLSAYSGTTRNGVTTSSYGSWACSYVFP